MWIVEVNVLGRRFTHEFNARRAVPTPHLPHWGTRKLRHPRAAA